MSKEYAYHAMRILVCPMWRAQVFILGLILRMRMALTAFPLSMYKRSLNSAQGFDWLSLNLPCSAEK